VAWRSLLRAVWSKFEPMVLHGNLDALHRVGRTTRSKLRPPKEVASYRTPDHAAPLSPAI
jgi:hypothetical protein